MSFIYCFFELGELKGKDRNEKYDDESTQRFLYIIYNILYNNILLFIRFIYLLLYQWTILHSEIQYYYSSSSSSYYYYYYYYVIWRILFKYMMFRILIIGFFFISNPYPLIHAEVQGGQKAKSMG